MCSACNNSFSLPLSQGSRRSCRLIQAIHFLCTAQGIPTAVRSFNDKQFANSKCLMAAKYFMLWLFASRWYHSSKLKRKILWIMPLARNTKYDNWEEKQTIPLAVRSKRWVCCRSLARIADLNPPKALITVCCKFCVLSDRRLCDGFVQRIPTECGVSEYDLETLKMRRPWPTRAAKS